MKLDPYLDFKDLLKINNKIAPKRKTAIITGGSGRIGSIFSSYLVLNDCEVIILSRNEKKFNLFKNSLPAKYREKLRWEFFDLEKASKNSVYKLIKNFKQVDILINNAASHLRGKNVNYDELILGNEFFGLVGSSVLITETVLKIMRKKKEGKIINIGSIWGHSSPKFSTYLEMDIAPSLMTSVCKSGIEHFTKYLAVREAKYNITVNCLSPGWFPRRGKKSRKDYIKMIARDVPLNRIGILNDLIPAVIFLLSNNNKYFTGQVIRVDGGHSIW